jgi:hypothetical protein
MTISHVVVAGRYRLFRSLGSGGMGRVWLARDEMLRRDVAVKEVVLPIGLTPEEHQELRRRTLREAQAAARLSHPNVVQIYDVVHTEDQPWIVMEYVPSRSLHKVINDEGPLPPDRTATIGLAVLAALDAAHRAGVLHRDVKPSNVLIADDGRVVLTDFGLATFDGGENAVTRPGLVLGSPQYISPERARDGDSSPESDLWSLGATLYAAVEGRSPFARATTMATLTALATERPDPMRRAGPLKTVLNGLLRKDAKARLDIPETERLLRHAAAGDPKVRGRRLPRPRAADRMTYLPATSPDAPTGGTGVGDATTTSPNGGTGIVPGRATRRWLWIPALALVLLLGAAGLVAFNQDTPRGSPTPGATAAPHARPPGAAPPDAVSSGPAPEASAAPGPYALPAGWMWYADPSGYKIAVPKFWTYTRDESLAYFREPGGDRTIAVGTWNPTSTDLVKAWTNEEADTRTVPGYQRVRIAPVATNYPAAAEWEYTFGGSDGRRLHAVDRCFRTSAGQTYVIRWQTTDFDFQTIQSYYQLMTVSFTAPS